MVKWWFGTVKKRFYWRKVSRLAMIHFEAKITPNQLYIKNYLISHSWKFRRKISEVEWSKIDSVLLHLRPYLFQWREFGEQTVCRTHSFVEHTDYPTKRCIDAVQTREDTWWQPFFGMFEQSIRFKWGGYCYQTRRFQISSRSTWTWRLVQNEAGCKFQSMIHFCRQ